MISSLGLFLALPLIPAACALLAAGRARGISPAIPLLIAWYIVDARTFDTAAALGIIAAAGVVASAYPRAARKVLGIMGAGFGALGVLMSAWPRSTWDAAGINPNVIAGIILLSGPFAGAGLPLSGGGLLATTSRSAWVGALVSALVSALAAWARHTRAGRRAMLALAVAAPACALALIAMRPGSVVVRMAVWNEAANLVAARPITGWGAGAYPQISQVRPGKLHADSLPLAIAVERGALGLALAAWWIRDATRRIAGMPRWALVAFAVQNIADCTAFNPWAAIALGLVINLPHCEKSQSAEKSRSFFPWWA